MSLKTSKTLGAVLAAGLTVSGLAAFQATAAADVDSGAGVLVYGLTTTNEIVQFRSTAPGTPLQVRQITGPAAAVDLVGIDVRPATGELYGVGANSTLYVIDPNTGASTTRGAFTPALDAGAFFGVDFNPAVDRLRIVSSTDQNLNVSPTGGPSTTTSPLTYAERGTGTPPNPDPRAGVDPDVRGAAYTNNFTGTAGTRLLDYDVAGADALADQTPTPDDGELNSIATPTVTTGTPRNINVAQDSTGTVGLDIEARTNEGLALLREGASLNLFAFDTDDFSPQGSVQAAETFTFLGAALPTLEDIAIASPRISITGSTDGREGGTATVTLTRTGDLNDVVDVVLSATNTATTTADTSDVSGPVTARFASGATQTVATVTLGGNDGVEADEVLGLRVTGFSTTNAAATRDNLAFITITDDGGTGAPPVPGSGTGTTSPAPSTSASARPSVSASASPSATSSASPSATARPSRLSISVSPATITPGVRSFVRITGTPGSVIELQAYSRPSTDYRVVRRGTIPSSGVIEFGVLPGTNTRLFAAVTGVAGTESPSIVINVRTALSLTVVRNGSRDYTFQGRILPRRAGQLISLYRVRSDGREVLTSQLKTDSSGTYRIRRVFTGSGVFGFLTRTGQTLTNAAGVSNGGRARPTAIYAGPQR